MRLSHYFEMRPETVLAPFIDQMLITYYNKMNHKLVRKFVIVAPLVIFIMG